jgi:tryptophan-rich sensory protein
LKGKRKSKSLEKPGWTQLSSPIGMIWQIIYPIIFVTFGSQAYRGKLPWLMALPFAINSWRT